MIETNGLTKSFKSFKKTAGFAGSVKSLFSREYTTKTAVSGFDLSIPKGQIVGLLGPNGAGKTTLMKMFTGIIVPTSGTLEVAGYNPWERSKEFRKKIALVMGQKSQLWWDIPALDSFLLLQKYYEIPEKQFRDRLNHMSQILNVKELLEVHVRKLSLGERMKLELMASLLHSPEVIFLDEPTIGLDLVAQENIRNFVREYHRDHNVTIILTSHYMADVKELCSRLVLIFDGEKRFDGALSKFETILGSEKSVSFHFHEPVNSADNFWGTKNVTWSDENKKAELLIEANDVAKVSADILTKFPVTDFHTDKLPIEKVMKTLMENPEILRESIQDNQ